MTRTTKTDDASHAEQVRIALDSPPWQSKQLIRQLPSAIRFIPSWWYRRLQPRDHGDTHGYGVARLHTVRPLRPGYVSGYTTLSKLRLGDSAGTSASYS